MALMTDIIATHKERPKVIPQIGLHYPFKKALEAVIVERFDKEFGPQTLTDAQRKRCHEEIWIMILEWVMMDAVSVASLGDLETKAAEYFEETRQKYVVR